MITIAKAFFACTIPIYLIASQIPGLSMIVTIPFLVVTDIISGTKYTVLSISMVLGENWQTVIAIMGLSPIHTISYEIFQSIVMIGGCIGTYVLLIKLYQRFPIFASSRVQTTIKTLKLLRGRWY